MNTKGYTLVEVMVSSLLILMVVGGGIAAYRNFEQKQAIVNAGRQFAVTLRATQKRAQSGEKPDECGTQNLDGWQVDKQINDDHYTTVAICDGVEVVASKKQHDLPGGVSFEQDDFNFIFEVISGNVDNPVSVQLNTTTGSRNYMVEVTRAGGIIESEVE